MKNTIPTILIYSNVYSKASFPMFDH